MDFYKTGRWRRLREYVLKRDKYLCQYSLRYGRRVEAVTVHHILPCEMYPQYRWCKWNLIALSNEAHNRMHKRGTHELTAEGRELAERIALPHLEQQHFKDS